MRPFFSLFLPYSPFFDAGRRAYNQLIIFVGI